MSNLSNARRPVSSAAASPLADNAVRYGVVTRALHWGMVLLFGWQYLGMGLKEVLGKTDLVSAITGTHVTVGLVILLLALARLVWALANLSHRPPHGDGLLGLAARLGHTLLYVLMVTVPALAALRLYGSGRGYQPFGIELLAPTGVKIDWMVAPANALHGVLAWTLLVFIAGHVAMVFVHQIALNDPLLQRMAGRASLRRTG